MKAFNGKEKIEKVYPHNIRHQILFEDDEDFKNFSGEELIWCGVESKEAEQIIEFINQTSILGVDNKIIKAAYGFRDLLKRQIDTATFHKIIY